MCTESPQKCTKDCQRGTASNLAPSMCRSECDQERAWLRRTLPVWSRTDVVALSRDGSVHRGRANDRPRAELYYAKLIEPLPTIPLPLARADADVPIDLQDLVDRVYERAGFDYSLDRSVPLQPPVPQAYSSWLADRLEVDPAIE